MSLNLWSVLGKPGVSLNGKKLITFIVLTFTKKHLLNRSLTEEIQQKIGKNETESREETFPIANEAVLLIKQPIQGWKKKKFSIFSFSMHSTKSPFSSVRRFSSPVICFFWVRQLQFFCRKHRLQLWKPSKKLPPCNIFNILPRE